MVWASGWRLAAAVSNAGGLGIIGAGSMYPTVLAEHLTKIKAATNKPYAVNVPLLYPNIAQLLQIIIAHKVPIVFTSAGNPASYTSLLKSHGIIVVHVVSSKKFALKAQAAGCHAVVAEGFEAGGHNGRDETTTLCLIPNVAAAINIPLIAAGGIYNGRSMLAAMVLGAHAVQIGSRFVASTEASSHLAFKQAVLQANEGDTKLMLKQLTPVRLLKNNFFNAVQAAENNCATPETLNNLLGKARAKLGMFQGNLNDGELEIGQCSSMIKTIMPAAEIVAEIWNDFLKAKQAIINW